METITDFRILRSFTSGIESLMVHTLILMIEELPKDIAVMKDAARQKNWDLLSSVAHRLRPNFMMVAREDIVKDIHMIELNAKHKVNLTELPDLVMRIDQCIPSLIEGMKSEAEKMEKDH